MSLFFSPSSRSLGPVLTDEMVASAERRLGVRLPQAYVKLLAVCNGGPPKRKCYRTPRATSWAPDHFQVQTLLGIGYDSGIDGNFGSDYMIAEWGYPNIGVVVFDTPSAGPDTVMLDYSVHGPHAEPRVVYVDDDGSALVVADTFSNFVSNLVDCPG